MAHPMLIPLLALAGLGAVAVKSASKSEPSDKKPSQLPGVKKNTPPAKAPGITAEDIKKQTNALLNLIPGVHVSGMAEIPCDDDVVVVSE